MKKKKKINGEYKGAAWLTTFNDLITLLMVFFVLLFTMSSIDIKKLKKFQHSLQTGLGVLKEGKRVSVEVRDQQSFSDVKSVTTQKEIEVDTPDKIQRQDKIQDIVKAFDSEPEIAATYTKKGVLITLSNTVLFQF